VHKLRTERLKERACSIDAVGGLAQSDAEGITALMTGFGRLQESVRGPIVCLRLTTSRIHRLYVDIGVFFHQVDARARPLDLAADGSGNREPLATGLAEIFDRTVGLAILLDDRP